MSLLGGKFCYSGMGGRGVLISMLDSWKSSSKLKLEVEWGWYIDDSGRKLHFECNTSKPLIHIIFIMPTFTFTSPIYWYVPHWRNLEN